MIQGLVAVAVFCTLSSPSLSFADDFRPEEIPPQQALKLFKAKGVKDTYYLITKDAPDANSRSSGNHYVLVYENGTLRFPRQTSGMVYFDGGSMDLRFENGERLLVPTDRRSVGYLGVSVAPMVMSPDRAPLRLQNVQISAGVLKRLGLAKFIASKAKDMHPTPAPQKQAEYVPFVSPDTAQIALFTSSTKLGYQEEDQLKTLLNQIDPSRIKIENRVNQGAFYGYGESKVIVLTEPEISLPKLRAQLEGRGEVKLLTDADLADLAKPFKDIASNFANANEQTKLSYVKQIFERMGELERLFLMADSLAQYETAVAASSKGTEGAYVGTAKNLKARRQHPIYDGLIEKIRSVARSGYETLHQMGHPAAQEILAHTAAEFDYVALDIIKGKAADGQKYYFELWLGFMLSDLGFIDDLTDDITEFPADIQASQSRGGVFQHFNISGELVGIEGRGIVPHYYGKRPKFPLNLLGLPGNKDRLKTSFIQYIIDADKKAAKLIAWSERIEIERGERTSASNSFRAKGISNITDLLTSLAWINYWASAIDGFSVSEYQVSVMDILTTLFDIASTSLKTTGTMAALIDATIHVLDNVQNAKGLLGAKSSLRVENAARTLENRLRVHLQTSVTSLAYVRSKEVAKACEILLAPNSFASAKRANGW